MNCLKSLNCGAMLVYFLGLLFRGHSKKRGDWLMLKKERIDLDL